MWNRASLGGRRWPAALVLLLLLAAAGCAPASPPAGDGQPPAPEPRPPVTSVVLVLDTSSSMKDAWAGGIKVQSAIDAALNVVDILETESKTGRRRFKVGVVEFATSASEVQPLTHDFDLVRSRLRELEAYGNTNIGHALELAVSQINNSTQSRSLIILLSDGQTNTGRSAGEIIDWVASLGWTPPKEFGTQASMYGFKYKDVSSAEFPAKAAAFLRPLGYKVGEYPDVVADAALGRLHNDSVFGFIGHASPQRLLFKETTKQVSLLSFKFNVRQFSFLESSQVKELKAGRLALAVLVGCETAKNISKPDNTARAFLNSGAVVVVGFAKKVEVRGANKWYVNFWQEVASGRNVYEAAERARTRARSESGEPTKELLYPSLDSMMIYPAAEASRLYLKPAPPRLRVDQSRVPTLYAIGIGDPGDLDEELLRQIAAKTGGEYYRGADSQGLQNAFLKTEHEALGDVELEVSGTVKPQETVEAGTVDVPANTAELRLTLNWPGSRVDAVLVDPRGRVVGPGYPGLQESEERPIHLVIVRPRPGEWKVSVKGVDVAPGGTPFYLVASLSPGEPARVSALYLLLGLMVAAGLGALAWGATAGRSQRLRRWSA
ncbi:MAG: VWA domain-containing protein [Acetobacteraceae bacterium]|nr:VWA domain-containing protein [Acetobacteraceae bacterium]